MVLHSLKSHQIHNFHGDVQKCRSVKIITVYIKTIGANEIIAPIVTNAVRYMRCDNKCIE